MRLMSSGCVSRYFAYVAVNRTWLAKALAMCAGTHAGRGGSAPRSYPATPSSLHTSLRRAPV